MLLNIVNDLSNIQCFSSVQDQSFFASLLHNFLVNFIHFIDDEDIPPLNNPGDLKIECNGTKTVSSSPAVEPLSLTPTRLKSISTMRDTLGQLEADFTQFQITSSGELQNMKDKSVQQDNLLKLQKQSIDTLSNDLSLHIKSLEDTLSQQLTLIKKLQEENASLQKKNAKIFELNVSLQEKHSQLQAEVSRLSYGSS